MAYIVPSPLVYQDLVNGGGVLNSTPDLEACIIGPAYNILEYVPGNSASLIKTAALSATATTATGSAGSTSLTVVSTAGFSVNDTVLISGGNTGGTTLQTTITAVTGGTMTLADALVVGITNAAVTKPGKITNSTINNSFTVPGSTPGQLVDTASVKVYSNDCVVETLNLGFRVRTGSNVLVLDVHPATTGAATAGSPIVVLVNNTYVVGDTLSIAGAGAAAGALVGTIISMNGNSVTLDVSASTTNAAGAVTEVIPTNLNTNGYTLRAQAGDTVTVSYVNTSLVASTFVSTIKNVYTSSGLNGTFTQIDMVDSLPAGVTRTTTGSGTAGTNQLTVASTTDLIVGEWITVNGSGTLGAATRYQITAIVGLVLTLDANIATSVVSATVWHEQHSTVAVRKTLQNVQVPGGFLNTASINTTGTVIVNANPVISAGKIISGNINIGYRALRTDLAGRVLTINNVSDLIGQLGVLSDQNPLALGVQLALANTTGRIRAIAIASDDLAGYQAALTTAEGERLYYLVPLTHAEDIHSTFASHVEQMSTPVNASWRVALVNELIPTTKSIGQYNVNAPNVNGSTNAISNIGGKFVLTASNATFIADGVAPGDIVNITFSSPTSTNATTKVLEVLSNQQIVVDDNTAETQVAYYITRTLSRTEMARDIAARSRGYGTKRVWMIMPDSVGVSINGVTKYLPGYYMAAAYAGMGAGFPVQQGFTNIGIAGIVDIQHSNFFFSKTELNSMAEAGVCIFVQETQGGIPYCRHAMTTDISVLEYREQLVVKNWDFLSYYYYDKVKSFIGKWNITKDTLNIVRQTLDASSALLKAQKLPKIGAPLIDANITKLEQDANNKDNLNVFMTISVVYPLNYLNLHLVI